jgi:serine/threonine protein kinase
MQLKNFAGTFAYSALECLTEKKYSKQSDLFAVGATIFEWSTQTVLQNRRRTGRSPILCGCPPTREAGRKQGERRYYIASKSQWRLSPRAVDPKEECSSLNIY